MEYITSMEDLCEHFDADSPTGLNRRIYKDTACGASISVLIAPEDESEFGDLRSFEEPYWIYNGERAFDYLTTASRLKAFTIQTIVEGSDAIVDSEPFVLPVKTSDVQKWIDYMEAEAEMLWEEANAEGGDYDTHMFLNYDQDVRGIDY